MCGRERSDPLQAQLYNERRDPSVLGSARQAIPRTAFVETLDLGETAKLAAIKHWRRRAVQEAGCTGYCDGCCYWSHRRGNLDRSKNSASEAV